MYVVLEDVVRDEGFVDTRVFVGLEVDEGFLGNALVRCLFCATHDD